MSFVPDLESGGDQVCWKLDDYKIARVAALARRENLLLAGHVKLSLP